MATTASAVGSEPAIEADPDFPPHRMTIDFFERLIESGVFGDKSPVFLWHGRLVEKMAPGRPHVFVVSILGRLLARLLPDGWYWLQEQPITVGHESMPGPDLVIVRGALRDYLRRRASESEVSLIVEVSDSTLAIDSKSVLKAYAAAKIPVYWIVNIPEGRVEVYWDPTGPDDEPSYREHRHYGPDDEVPVVLDGREIGRIAAREILP